MVGSTRVLMVSRHYWPHHSIDAVNRDVRLADALSRGGTHVEVLTPRYAASWPEQLTHREIPVHRPITAPRSQWSIGRYLKSLQAWLSEHAEQYDVLFCTSLSEEVIPVVQTAWHSRPRCVLGHSGTGAAADHLAWGTLRHARRLRASVHRADAIVVSWASVQRDLVAEGFAPQKLHRIELGVMAGAAPPSPAEAAGESARTAKARVALAEINGDLALHRNSIVVLSCGQMTPLGGMLTLAQAASGLIDRWPDLRLWLIGDGGLREELHGYFRTRGIRQNVAMPGTFVDFEDLFTVSSLMVVPSAADALQDTLQRAIAAAVPLVVVDAADTRAFFSGCEQAVGWFTAADSESLRSAISAALGELPARRAAAERLRRDLLRRCPYESTVQRYKQLFETLAASARAAQVAAAASPTQCEP